MAPASTLRRKDATIAGRTTRTPKTTTAAMMSVEMGKAGRRSAIDRAHDATSARRVDVGDANHVAATHAHAAGTVIRAERGEQLYDLSVDFDGHEPASGRVEAGHGTCVVLDRA